MFKIELGFVVGVGFYDFSVFVVEVVFVGGVIRYLVFSEDNDVG